MRERARSLKSYSVFHKLLTAQADDPTTYDMDDIIEAVFNLFPCGVCRAHKEIDENRCAQLHINSYRIQQLEDCLRELKGYGRMGRFPKSLYDKIKSLLKQEA